jgi:hypothetical protein
MILSVGWPDSSGLKWREARTGAAHISIRYEPASLVEAAPRQPPRQCAAPGSKSPHIRVIYGIAIT